MAGIWNKCVGVCEPVKCRRGIPGGNTGGKCQTVCKPGSVPIQSEEWMSDGHSSGTSVTERLSRPTRTATRKHACPSKGLPSLLGLAPGGVYHAAPVAGRAVRSYRTLSPLPRSPGRNRQARRYPFCGTFPGVAPAGRYPAPCFRGARTFLPPQPEDRERQPSNRLA